MATGNPRPAIRDTLLRFRATHPYSSVRVSGVRWDYIACGQGTGGEAVLLLPGLPGRADTAFEHILAFEQRYRVIAPAYPAPPATVAEMLDGLAAVLRAENVHAAHVVGGSYSGLIAQSFVRRYPDMVASVVLSDTGVPDRARARRYAYYRVLLRVLPQWAIRAIWRAGAYRYVREIRSERPFWRAYFRELISTISKKDCVGRLRVWMDFDLNSRFSPGDLAGWPGSILILEAEHDATFPPHERAALRRLYPQAQLQVFHGAGHAASIDRRAEYIAAIAVFLDAAPQRVEAVS